MKILGNILGMLLAAVFLWMLFAIGYAYEEHKLCMNGAIEHCIEQDFN